MTEKTTDAENGASTETSNEDVSGLKAKVTELLGLLKTEKDAREAAERKANNAKNSNLTELEQMKLRAETAEGETATAKATIRTMTRDAAIADIITANKVDPSDVRAVKAILLMELDADSDEPTTKGGQSLADYSKAFFAKEGKRYVQVADHNGGGASGSEGSKAPRMTKDNWNWSEFAKIQMENPEEARAIASAAGKDIKQMP